VSCVYGAVWQKRTPKRKHQEEVEGGEEEEEEEVEDDEEVSIAILPPNRRCTSSGRTVHSPRSYMKTATTALAPARRSSSNGHASGTGTHSNKKAAAGAAASVKNRFPSSAPLMIKIPSCSDDTGFPLLPPPLNAGFSVSLPTMPPAYSASGSSPTSVADL
jgi:hypothetical protein